jgi:hypothetical protein
MAPRLGARDPPITRRCRDGSSRDVYIRGRRAQRGALADRRRTREEAACLEASEASPGTTAPAKALRPDVCGPRDKRASAGCRFARVAPRPPGRRRNSSRGSRSPAHAAPARRPLRGGAPRGLPHLRDELEEIAHEAAGDALISVLAQVDDFGGESGFTTWVYKFALLETAVKLRKRAWQSREVPLEADAWNLFENVGLTPPAGRAERAALDVADWDWRGADLAPTPRARGGNAERRADRRPRRASRYDTGRDLQDVARRSPQAARAPRRAQSSTAVAPSTETADRRHGA